MQYFHTYKVKNGNKFVKFNMLNKSTSHNLTRNIYIKFLNILNWSHSLYHDPSYKRLNYTQIGKIIFPFIST
jgi:hypothetical protein